VNQNHVYVPYEWDLSTDSVDESEVSDHSSDLVVADQNAQAHQDEESSESSYNDLINDQAEEVNAEESEGDEGKPFSDDFRNNEHNSEAEGLGGSSSSSGSDDSSSFSCSTQSTSDHILLIN
jgi:hypothetical protein